MLVRVSIPILSMAALCCLLSGCTYGRTNEFVAPESIAPTDLYGWEIIPDIYSCRNIVSKEPCGAHFLIGLELSRHKEKKRPLGNTILIEIDTLIISFADGVNRFTCPLSSAIWATVSDVDHISRYLDFEGPIDARVIRIPETAKEIELEFMVRIREGYHFFAAREGSQVPLDTISPQGEILQLKPMKVRLVRHETAQKLPFFFQ